MDLPGVIKTYTNLCIIVRPAFVTGRSAILRLRGLSWNENLGGSNNSWCENHHGL